ncbi:MAG: hypothetical protein LBR79_06315 [Oscillospiraceae bacterium]|jgi:hypothetical protein|nr:hypothetical protein [Oscillospiraceae bacterium]
MSKKVEFSDAAKKAFKNKIFVRELLAMETGEQVREALEEKDIVLSADELDKFAEVLIVALEKGSEVTDDDLKEVVGGVNAVISCGASCLAATAADLGGLPTSGYFANRKEHMEKCGSVF